MSTEETEKVQAIIAEGVAREGLQEMVLPAEEAAAKRLADFVSDAAIDRMIVDAQDAGVPLLDGPGGLIGQLTARVIERALGAEMDDHLGYVKGDPAGNGTGIPGTALREDGYHDVGPGAVFGAAGPEIRFRAADRGERAAARRPGR